MISGLIDGLVCFYGTRGECTLPGWCLTHPEKGDLLRVEVLLSLIVMQILGMVSCVMSAWLEVAGVKR